MANYRVKIGSTDMGLSSAVVSVGWDSVIEYKPDADSIAYTDGPKSEVLINCARLPSAWGEDRPDVFQSLVDESENCTVFQFAVEVECEPDTWAEVWAGEFSSKDWKVDLDKKTIAVKPKRSTDADCIRSEWTATQNPYDLEPVEVLPYIITIEDQTVLSANVPWGEPCEDYQGVPPTDYCLELIQEQFGPGEVYGVNRTCVFLYFRQVLAGSCSGSTPVEPDTWNTWTLLDDNCPTGSTWWLCPGVNDIVFTFSNGRLFADVLEYMVGQTGCGLTVKSDFFNINPDSTAPSNAAYTAAAAKLARLVLFQKSDVKRHDASDKSKKPAWVMKLRDLLKDLQTMFNVRWRAEAGVFRIEHVSYFDAQAGNDYTSAAYIRQLDQDKTDIVRVAKFRWRDERATDYFLGSPIVTYCGEGENETAVTLFSTDAAFAISADGLEAVGDDGFLLMSCYLDGDDLRMLDGNRPLSWTELHYDYHRHNMAGAGEINGTEVTPLSIRRTRKAPRFAVRHCCDDTFDPAEYQTTSMGNGGVLVAEHNHAKDILTLELNY